MDQLSFFTSTSENNVPYVDKIPNPPDSVGPGLFKNPVLMGIFPVPPPHTVQVNMISRSDDPWIIPSPEQVTDFGESVPLTLVEINYCEIVAASDPPLSQHAPLIMALDIYFQSPWLDEADSPNPLKETFPSDEAIIETMSLEELPWSDGHHRSSFMPSLGAMSDCLERDVSGYLSPEPPLLSSSEHSSSSCAKLLEQ